MVPFLEYFSYVARIISLPSLFGVYVLSTTAKRNVVDGFDKNEVTTSNVSYLPCTISTFLFICFGFFIPCLSLVFMKLARHAMRSLAPGNHLVENVDNKLHNIDKVGAASIFHCHRNYNCFVFVCCLMLPSFLCAIVFGAATWFLCESIITGRLELLTFYRAVLGAG